MEFDPGDLPAAWKKLTEAIVQSKRASEVDKNKRRKLQAAVRQKAMDTTMQMQAAFEEQFEVVFEAKSEREGGTAPTSQAREMSAAGRQLTLSRLVSFLLPVLSRLSSSSHSKQRCRRQLQQAKADDEFIRQFKETWLESVAEETRWLTAIIDQLEAMAKKQEKMAEEGMDEAEDGQQGERRHTTGRSCVGGPARSLLSLVWLCSFSVCLCRQRSSPRCWCSSVALSARRTRSRSRSSTEPSNTRWPHMES